MLPLLKSSMSVRTIIMALLLMLILFSSSILEVNGFVGITPPPTTTTTNIKSAKEKFLVNLDEPYAFNGSTKERTELVRSMCTENPTIKPGSTASFAPVAVGTWRIVYAPHISTMAKLFGGGGSFDPVYYILRSDGTMTSHAKYQFPIIGHGWLSVSGTYSSQDEDQVCRVDFNKAWVKINSDDHCRPYPALEDVPPNLATSFINWLGKLAFLESVSVFPVSYLDQDTIVFDFELLGTRICARKVQDKV